jgi:acetyltransferase-like isoleucine patch superfamily enzyme
MEYIRYAGVELGEGAEVGPYAILGTPPRGKAEGELPTRIGPGAVIRSHTVIYAGNVIGAGFQAGNGAMLREENEIGDKVSVGAGSVVEHHVRIGDGVRIHSQAFVPEHSVLEKGCWIGPNVVLTNARYPNRPDTKHNLAGVHVGEKAVIGANSTVLPGVRIGRGALVGAGSVVVRDVPDYTVVVGNPARVVRVLAESERT